MQLDSYISPSLKSREMTERQVGKSTKLVGFAFFFDSTGFVLFYSKWLFSLIVKVLDQPTSLFRFFHKNPNELLGQLNDNNNDNDYFLN